jgi:hypothetical protein
MTNEIETTVNGSQVQHDNSGVGHNWRNIDASDIPSDVREEIEGEMIDGNGAFDDGGRDSCDDFTASNGLHYRW